MRERAVRAVFVVGCLYEAAAVSTRRVPTWTHLVKTARDRHPVGRLLVWTFLGFVSWHFLEPLPAVDS